MKKCLNHENIEQVRPSLRFRSKINQKIETSTGSKYMKQIQNENVIDDVTTDIKPLS